MGFVQFIFSSFFNLPLKLSLSVQSLLFWSDVFFLVDNVETMTFQTERKLLHSLGFFFLPQVTNKPLEKQMSGKMLYFSSSHRYIFIKDYKRDNLGHLGHLFNMIMRNVKEWEQ